MTGNLQPLDQKFQVVLPDGTPTQYFIRWAQQRQIDIAEAISAEEAQELIDTWAANRQIIAGVALDGGGDLSTDVTIDHADSTVTPGSYTLADITIDAQGHITAAANGTPGASGIDQLTGDVTAGPGSGSQAATIANDAVTYAKMQNVSAASRLVGRGSAAGAGDPQEIALGTGLSMSGTTLNVSVTDTGITQLTGDVTAGPGSGSQAATIPNDTVTYAKIQNVSAASRLLGRGSAAGAGDPQEIVLGTGLSLSGTTLNASGVSPSDGYWSPLTNGDGSSPELIFTIDGDTIAVWTAT